MAGKTLLRYDATMVNLADGSLVRVNRGGALPDNLADGELARLEALGAFDPAPSRQTVRVIADDTGAPVLDITEDETVSSKARQRTRSS